MSGRRESTAVIGAGVVACAACCAGPIVGVLAAIGFGTAAGTYLFGLAALVLGAVAAGAILLRRRPRRVGCAAADTAVPVTLSARFRS